jgi:photosystem II stability/assembly factor-like uncharacterized protein
LTSSSSVSRIVALLRRRAAKLLLGSVLCALALAVTCGLASAVSSTASSGKISAHLTKTSFTGSQASSVKLICKFSKKSGSFSYLLTFKKGSKWQTVKSVSKKSYSKGSYTMTAKQVFGGKSVKAGSYRLKLSAGGSSKTLSFKVVKAGPSGSGGSNGAPSNTSIPVITGTAKHGQTLTASTGSWDNSPTGYKYQWRRCDSAGNTCSDISGASSSKYILQLADVGSTSRVAVTATNAYGSGSAASAQSTVIAQGPIPEIVDYPVITGEAKELKTLTASTGNWANSPTAYQYWWWACTNDTENDCWYLNDVSSSTYQPTGFDVGDVIGVTVVASNDYGPGYADSDVTSSVMGIPPASTAAPAIYGEAIEGQTLIATHGSWQYEPTSFDYQWRRCDSAGVNCSPIASTNWPFYALRSEDAGHTIRVAVSASNDWGSSTTPAISAQTNAIEGIPVAGGWDWQQPRPQGNPLAGISFVGVDHGWAVGSNGTVVGTSDGGVHWFTEASAVTYDLYGVSFTHDSSSSTYDGWAVGWAGTIVHTTDGGSSWTKQDSGTDADLYSISCADASDCTAVGWDGTVVHSSNGGTHWSLQDSGTDEDLLGVTFIDSAHGWAVGTNGAIVTTSNGGTTWSAQSTGVTSALYAVSFADSTHGWAVGENEEGTGGTILVTNDGGLTWNQNTAGYPLYSVSVQKISGNYVGWAVGDRGTIMKTTGGTTWSNVTPSAGYFGYSYYGVSLIDSSHVVIVDEFGNLFATADGGTNWSDGTAGSERTLLRVAFYDSTHGIAVGKSDNIFVTSDGGATWTHEYGTLEGEPDLKAVTWADATHAWAIGASQQTFSTSDGGLHWSSAWEPDSGMESIRFVGTQLGWAAGDRGTIVATTDSGENWSEQLSLGAGFQFNGVDFTDQDHGWTAGWQRSSDDTTYSYLIYSTADGGSHWSRRSIPTVSGELQNIHFLDANHGWAVGWNYDSTSETYSSSILSTSDGGASWNVKTLDDVELNDIHFSDLNHGWVVGAEGVILSTSDGGLTWHLQNSRTDNDLFGLAFTNADHGWVVGENGTILATATGGDPPTP